MELTSEAIKELDAAEQQIECLKNHTQGLELETESIQELKINAIRIEGERNALIEVVKLMIRERNSRDEERTEERTEESQ